jgi:hypothetical protein
MRIPMATRLFRSLLGILLLFWWGLLLLLSPIIIVYALLLLAPVWFGWHKKGKDVLVVSSGAPYSKKLMEEIDPLLGTRAIYLDWDKRDVWPRWSVAPRLFGLYSLFYGPQPFALAHSLPIALIFPRFRKPRFLVMGGTLDKSESNLGILKNELD